jgi:hypothetical protein
MLLLNVYQEKKSFVQIAGNNPVHVIFPLPLPNVSTEGTVEKLFSNTIPARHHQMINPLLFGGMKISTLSSGEWYTGYFSTLLLSRDTRIFS